MVKPISLLILGASGACGRWVTDLAVSRGHKVTVVARREAHFEPPIGAHLVTGEILAPGVLESVLAEETTVISCLGIRRSSLFPWAGILSPPDFVEQVSKLIVNSSATKNIRRLVWMSAGGVGASLSKTSPVIRMMIRLGNVGTAYQDLEKAEEALRESGVESVAVRPVTLKSGAPIRRGKFVNRYRLLSTIRRSEVAEFLLDLAESRSLMIEEDAILG